MPDPNYPDIPPQLQDVYGPPDLSPPGLPPAYSSPMPAAAMGAPLVAPAGGGGPQPGGWGFLAGPDYSQAQANMALDPASSLMQARRAERLTPTGVTPILGGGAVAGGQAAPAPGLPSFQAAQTLPPSAGPDWTHSTQGIGKPVFIPDEGTGQRTSEAGSRPETSGPTVIPAHEQKLVSQARQDELRAANEGRISAVTGQEGAQEAEGMAEAEASKTKAEGMGKEAALGDEQAKSVAHRAAWRQDLAESLLADLDKQQIDPMHYMNSRSTEQQILDHIGGMFAGWGAGLHGTSNSYVDHMHQLIRNDIEAQRDNIKNKNSLYHWAYEVTGDRDEAMKVAETLALKSVARMTDAAVEGAQSPAILARAAQARARLEEHAANINQGRVEDEIQMNPWVPAQMLGGTTPGLTKEEAEQIIRVRDAKGNLIPIQVADPEQRKQVDLRARAAAQILDRNRRIQAILAEGASVSPAKLGELKSLISNNVTAYPTMLLGSTRESQNVEKTARDLFPDPDAMSVHDFTGKAQATVQALSADAERILNDIQGQFPVLKTGYGQDATGRLHPTAEFVGKNNPQQTRSAGAKDFAHVGGTGGSVLGGGGGIR